MTTKTLKLTFPDFSDVSGIFKTSLGRINIKKSIQSLHLNKLLQKISDASYVFSIGFVGSQNRQTVNNTPSMSNFKKISPKKIIPIAIILVSVAIAVVGAFRLISKVSGKSSTDATPDGRVTIEGAKASVQLNKEFTFPIKDSKDKKITDLKFAIESAELRNEIIVKGKRATAIEGRTFLILNVKVNSSFNKAIQINTQDYVRLMVNGNEEEKLAPDIHNDPLVIQPTSTKFSRVGFAINDSDKNLILQVGEIDGEKTNVNIDF